jgi:hypothetical protein
MGASYASQWSPRTFIPRVFEIAAFVASRWIVMMRRAILAFAILIALSQTATAGVLLFGHVM